MSTFEPSPRLVCVEPRTDAYNKLWYYFAKMIAVRYGDRDMNSYNPEYREVWQYMGTVLREHDVQHQFRHRMHPKTKKREYLSFELEYDRAHMEAYRTPPPVEVPKPFQPVMPDLDDMGNAYSDADPGL